MPLTYERPEGPLDKEQILFLFVSDTSLDRDWNSPAFSFRSGYFLARALASFGIGSIRYDHRGFGKNISRQKTKHDFELKAQDLRTMHSYAHKKKAKKLILLAHGNNACLLLLYSLQRWKLPHDGLVLLSCGANGDALDIWARKLFFNMKRKGAKKETITQVQEEWRQIKEMNKEKRNEMLKKTQNKADSKKEKIPPNLAAFRKAVAFLYSPALKSFRKETKDLHLFSLIKRTVYKKIPTLHITAVYDEERPLSEQRATIEFAQKIQKTKKTASLYRFIELEGCGHFLKEQSQTAQGLALVLARMNPFRSLDPQAVREIIRFADTVKRVL